MIQKNRYFTLFAAVAVLESCCCEIMPIMVPAVQGFGRERYSAPVGAHGSTDFEILGSFWFRNVIFMN